MLTCLSGYKSWTKKWYRNSMLTFVSGYKSWTEKWYRNSMLTFVSDYKSWTEKWYRNSMLTFVSDYKSWTKKWYRNSMLTFVSDYKSWTKKWYRNSVLTFVSDYKSWTKNRQQVSSVRRLHRRSSSSNLHNIHMVSVSFDEIRCHSCVPQYLSSKCLCDELTSSQLWLSWRKKSCCMTQTTRCISCWETYCCTI